MDLILEPSWAYRRKDTLRLVTFQCLRHRTTLDFDIPSGTGLGTDGNVCIPFTFIGKRPAASDDYDLVDASGTSLRMPGSLTNRAMSALVVLELLMRIDPDPDPELIRILFEVAMQPDGVRGKKALKESNWRKYLSPAAKKHKVFLWLVDTVAFSSLVAVVMKGQTGDPAMIKMSYEERVDPRPDNELGEFGVEFPYIAAKTYHLDIQLPDSFRVKEAVLGVPHTVRSGSGVAFEEFYGRVGAERTHIYIDDATKCRKGFAQTKLRPRSELNLLSISPIVAAAMSTSLVVAYVASLVALSRPIQSIALPLLLLFPAIAATHLTASEDPLAMVVLARVRRALLITVTCVFLGAICLIAQPIIGPNFGFLATMALGVLMAIALASTGLMWFARFEARR